MEPKSLLKEALNLRPAERLHLIQKLLQSLDIPDEAIDKIWAEESENRYEAYKEGKVKTIDLKEIIERYRPK